MVNMLCEDNLKPLAKVLFVQVFTVREFVQ